MTKDLITLVYFAILLSLTSIRADVAAAHFPLVTASRRRVREEQGGGLAWAINLLSADGSDVRGHKTNVSGRYGRRSHRCQPTLIFSSYEAGRAFQRQTIACQHSTSPKYSKRKNKNHQSYTIIRKEAFALLSTRGISIER